MRAKSLDKLMAREGFEVFQSPGFEAFRKDSVEIRFFWWSNAKAAQELNVPRSSLVLRTSMGDDTHISLVEWPSEEQKSRKWAEVEREILAEIDRAAMGGDHAE
jgi:hypothetical protein